MWQSHGFSKKHNKNTRRNPYALNNVKSHHHYAMKHTVYSIQNVDVHNRLLYLEAFMWSVSMFRYV